MTQQSAAPGVARAVALAGLFIACGSPAPPIRLPSLAAAPATVRPRPSSPPPHLATPFREVGTWEEDDLAIMREPTALRRLVIDERSAEGTAENEPPSLIAVAGLRGLRYLAIRSSRLTDASAIGDMPQLEVLVFNGSARLAVLGELRGLGALWHLGLYGTEVSDLTALTSLSLRSLDLGGTAASDIRPLATMGSLEELSLAGTFVEDLSAVSHLRHLVALDLSYVPADDFSPLAALPCLRRLVVDYVTGLDLGRLRLPGPLESLSIRGTGVVDLTPLAGRRALTELWLSHNPGLADLGPIARLEKLRFVDLTGTGVTDLRPLEGLPALQRIVLNESMVTTAERERFKRVRGEVVLHTDPIQSSDHFRTPEEAARTRAAILAAEQACSHIPSRVPTRLWAGAGGATVILPHGTNDPRASCVKAQLDAALLAPNTGGGVLIPARP
jgi:hypothetical protein